MTHRHVQLLQSKDLTANLPWGLPFLPFLSTAASPLLYVHPTHTCTRQCDPAPQPWSTGSGMGRWPQVRQLQILPWESRLDLRQMSLRQSWALKQNQRLWHRDLAVYSRVLTSTVLCWPQVCISCRPGRVPETGLVSRWLFHFPIPILPEAHHTAAPSSPGPSSCSPEMIHEKWLRRALCRHVHYKWESFSSDLLSLPASQGLPSSSSISPAGPKARGPIPIHTNSEKGPEASTGSSWLFFTNLRFFSN